MDLNRSLNKPHLQLQRESAGTDRSLRERERERERENIRFNEIKGTLPLSVIEKSLPNNGPFTNPTDSLSHSYLSSSLSLSPSLSPYFSLSLSLSLSLTQPVGFRDGLR
jgi:hypothetical protein